MPYTELTDELLEMSKRLDYVDAFYVHGSRAIGRHTPYSDIDYQWFVKSKKDIKRLEKEVFKIVIIKEWPAYLGDGVWHFWDWKGKTVGGHIDITGEMLERSRKLFRSEEFFLEQQDWAQHAIVEGSSLYDPERYLKRIKLNLSKYPKTLSRKIADRFTKRLENKYYHWNYDGVMARNVFQHLSDLKEVVREIAIAHYALNRKFFMNSMKRYSYDIGEFKPDIRKEMKVVVAVDYSLSNGKEKIKALGSIAKKFRIALH